MNERRRGGAGRWVWTPSTVVAVAPGGGGIASAAASLPPPCTYTCHKGPPQRQRRPVQPKRDLSNPTEICCLLHANQTCCLHPKTS